MTKGENGSRPSTLAQHTHTYRYTLSTPWPFNPKHFNTHEHCCISGDANVELGFLQGAKRGANPHIRTPLPPDPAGPMLRGEEGDAGPNPPPPDDPTHTLFDLGRVGHTPSGPVVIPCYVVGQSVRALPQTHPFIRISLAVNGRSRP